MKNISSRFFLAMIIVLMTANIAFSQILSEPPDGQDLQRKGAWLATEDAGLWVDAFIKATGERSQEMVFFTINIGGKISSFWKGNEFQTAMSRKLVARVPLISKPVLNDWWEALKKSSGNSQLNKLFPIILLVHQDRLFVNGAFNNEESKILLTRVNSIPLSAILQWKEATKTELEEDAAISIASLDSAFVKNVFKEELFRKAVATARQPKSNTSSKTPSVPFNRSPETLAAKDPISGEWQVTLNFSVSGQVGEQTLNLKCDGEKVTGQRVLRNGKITEIANGSWVNQQLTLTFVSEMNSGKLTTVMSGKLLDGKLSGTFQGKFSDEVPTLSDMLKGTWEASKKK